MPCLNDNLIPYGILPPLLILSIERKQLHDESVNLRKSQHLTLRVLDRHRDQRDQAGRKEAMVRWEFWGWMELVDWRFSRLVPFLSSDQQQQLGGRSLLNQQKVFPSQCHIIVALRRIFPNEFRCLLLPPQILGWLRSPSEKVVWGRLMCTLCYCATGTCSLGSTERGPL